MNRMKERVGRCTLSSSVGPQGNKNAEPIQETAFSRIFRRAPFFCPEQPGHLEGAFVLQNICWLGKGFLSLAPNNLLPTTCQEPKGSKATAIRGGGSPVATSHRRHTEQMLLGGRVHLRTLPPSPPALLPHGGRGAGVTQEAQLALFEEAKVGGKELQKQEKNLLKCSTGLYLGTQVYF